MLIVRIHFIVSLKYKFNFLFFNLLFDNGFCIGRNIEETEKKPRYVD